MKIRKFAKDNLYLFVIIVFIVNTTLPVPLIIAFKFLDLDMENLRLIIPILNSIFAVALWYYLGWFKLIGLNNKVKEFHCLWVLLAIVFVPVTMFGTVEITSSMLLFYFLAILFTGVSEEAFFRGVLINVLLPKGKWLAVIVSALIFSISHFSNLMFENFGITEMLQVLWLTFSSAILYSALYLRTGNIWPLIILHTLHDFIFLITGTAGPFTATPLPTTIHIVIGIVSIVYGVYIVRIVDEIEIITDLNKAESI